MVKKHRIRTKNLKTINTLGTVILISLAVLAGVVIGMYAAEYLLKINSLKTANGVLAFLVGFVIAWLFTNVILKR